MFASGLLLMMSTSIHSSEHLTLLLTEIKKFGFNTNILMITITIMVLIAWVGRPASLRRRS